MIDLTHKIFSLDLEAASEVNHANAVSMEAKREADLHAEQQMEKAQQLFEKQKKNETEQLAKSVKEDRKRALDNLQKKRETFDNDVEVDALVEHLVSVEKGRICR